MSDSVTPWTVAHQVPLSIIFSRPRILEWVAIPFSMGSSRPRKRTWVSYIAGRCFTIWANRDSQKLTEKETREVLDSGKGRYCSEEWTLLNASSLNLGGEYETVSCYPLKGTLTLYTLFLRIMNLVLLLWWKKSEFPDFPVVLCHHVAIIQQLLNSQCTHAGATAVNSPSTWRCTHASIPPTHRDRDRERNRDSQRPTDKRTVWETHYWLYSQPWSWEETTKHLYGIPDSSWNTQAHARETGYESSGSNIL